MPYLGDYVGQLLSEIATARAQADLETVRIAEQYAAHPYLKHFPIPHLRLPTITIDIAYVVDESEPVPPAGPVRGSVDPKAMRKSMEEVVTAAAKRHGLAINEETRAKLRAALDDIVTPGAKPGATGVPLRATAVSMAEAVVRVLRESSTERPKGLPESLKPVRDDLREMAHAAFLGLSAAPPRLQVLVTKKQLAEIKNPDLMSRLRLTVSEEGQEWTIVDVDGSSTERLTAE